MPLLRSLKFFAMAVLVVAVAGCAGAEKKPMDIVDTAASAGQFNTLVAAVQAAGLVDTLKGPGPFTVFAPTDEAFAKLGRNGREPVEAREQG